MASMGGSLKRQYENPVGKIKNQPGKRQKLGLVPPFCQSNSSQIAHDMSVLYVMSVQLIVIAVYSLYECATITWTFYDHGQFCKHGTFIIQDV